jgi:hypothetical protein
LVGGVSGLLGGFSLKAEASGNKRQLNGILALLLTARIALELFKHLHLIHSNYTLDYNSRTLNPEKRFKTDVRHAL